MMDIVGELLILTSSGYLILLALFCFSGSIRDIKVKKRQLSAILGLMIIAYSTLVFFIIGREGWDLNVYYSVIESMREDGFNAVQSSGGIDFFDLPFVKILFYLISKLPYNNFLQLISVTIDYVIFFVILKMVIRKREVPFRSIALFIIVHFAMSSFAYTISGIRNTMAFSVVSFAIIRDLYYKKHDLLTILLYIIPFGIHPAVVIVILLRSFLFIFKKWPFLQWGLLLWVLGLKVVIKIVKTSDKLLFLEMLISKAEYYLDLGFINLFSNFKYELLRIIVVVCLWILVMKCLKRTDLSKPQKHILWFIKISCLLTIGSIPVYVIFDRLCIFIGWIAFYPFTLNTEKFGIWRIKKGTVILLPAAVLLILMNLHHLFVFSQINIPWR